MTLQGLLTVLIQRPEFRRLLEQLRKAEGLPALTGITEAARPYLLAALAGGMKQPILVVTTDEEQANLIVEELKSFVLNPNDVCYLPDRDALDRKSVV